MLVRIVGVLLGFCAAVDGLSGHFAVAQIPSVELFRRVTRVSNFEFALYNNGLLFGDYGGLSHPDGLFAPCLGHWPRGSFHLRSGGRFGGFFFGAKKSGHYYVSDAGYAMIARAEHGPFSQTVPGWVGDPFAGYDSLYNGHGWKYVSHPDFIVYSSMDHDSLGFDISGSNANDWPMRLVQGDVRYVRDPRVRSLYPPVYVSDEDFACIFKDTETAADMLFEGPGGPSEPIGIDVENRVFTWGEGPLSNVVVVSYRVTNQTAVALDSCFLGFGLNVRITGGGSIPIRHRIRKTDHLVYTEPYEPSDWGAWRAGGSPPTIGLAYLKTPLGYQGNEIGMKHGVCGTQVSYQRIAGDSSLLQLGLPGTTDSLWYDVIRNPLSYSSYPWCELAGWPVAITGPFELPAYASVQTSLAIIFADSLPHLRLLHDLIKRMHANNYQRPSAPPAPQLTVKGLNRAIKLTWDSASEHAEDIIIPDSLGRPFVGYRLLRAAREEGPYTELARWHVDSALVHEYIDRGEDIGGLKNNVRYYYRLLSFDEGAPRLKLEPMESKPEKGVNWQSVVPGTDAANTTAIESSGLVVTGTLGGVWLPRLMPENTTNFTSYFSGRTITMRLQTSTDGTRYTLPVTIRDTVAGREQFAILDPGLMVHGHPGIAGIKEGVLHVPDIFGIGGARIEVPYRYEQLPDSFRVGAPTIEGEADVPILTRDSLNVTGIQTINPYFESGRGIIVHFEPGGVDTLNLLFGVILPYLNVRITDAETGEEYERNRDWTLRVYAVRSTGGGMTTTVRNRYYLTGTAPNGHIVDAGHLLTIHNTTIAFDFPDRGQGSGKPAALFPWGSGHRSGTRDFAVGERVRIRWEGGARGGFPDATIHLTGAPPQLADVTEEMMENIRIVPNPYLIRHEAQRGEPRIYFNYLPDECTIRIYTVALDLVRTLHHNGGSRVEWDLTTEGGQLVASQMLIAHIEAPNGKSTTKKFSVVVGR